MNVKKAFQSAAIAALALGAQTVALAGQQDGIIGGETVRAGDPIASSTVLIVGMISATKQYICTGSLIAKDMIVTAAHCVAENIKAPVDPSKIVLVFGLTAPKTAAEARNTPMTRVANYLYNPGWKGAVNGGVSGIGAHDIAVIHFDGALPAGYAPATLLDASVDIPVGAKVTLAGYGIDDAATQAGAGILRKVGGVPVAELLGKTEIDVDESGGIGSCSGDSGGPAFLAVHGENFLWGVTSRGDMHCAQDGIYTRISAYTDFITQAESTLRGEKQPVAMASAAGERGRAGQHQASERALSVASAVSEALSVQ